MNGFQGSPDYSRNQGFIDLEAEICPECKATQFDFLQQLVVILAVSEVAIVQTNVAPFEVITET